MVISQYMISGVALAQARFGRALAEVGHEVHFLIGSVQAGLPQPIVPGVKVTVLGRTRTHDMMGPLWKHLRSDNPGIVFSAEDHMNIIVLIAAILARSKAMISCSSRVTPFDTYSNVPLTKRWLLKQMARLVWWRANVLTCVSEDMVEQYRHIFSRSRHVPVYNIIDDAGSRKKIQASVDHSWFNDKDRPVVVAAGMLEPWKGFADLICAVGILVRKGLPIRLLILGEGSLRPDLESLIIELGLGDAVQLFGRTDNPLKFFARADLFALSSTVEGLPNVLVEAMMCGCTPVSTDCPTGPREVLQGGRYGYLVPVRDPAAMAAGIEQGLANPIPPSILAEAVRPFEQSEVIRRHFELLGLQSASPKESVFIQPEAPRDLAGHIGRESSL